MGLKPNKVNLAFIPFSSLVEESTQIMYEQIYQALFLET